MQVAIEPGASNRDFRMALKLSVAPKNIGIKYGIKPTASRHLLRVSFIPDPRLVLWSPQNQMFELGDQYLHNC
jgi:hypothetical protein